MSTRLLAEYAAMTFREVRNLCSSKRSMTRSAHQAFDDAVDEGARRAPSSRACPSSNGDW